MSKRVGKKQQPAISTKLSHGASSDSNSVQLSGWAHVHQELKGSSLIDDQHKTKACLCTHAYVYIYIYYIVCIEQNESGAMCMHIYIYLFIYIHI